MTTTSLVTAGGFELVFNPSGILIFHDDDFQSHSEMDEFRKYIDEQVAAKGGGGPGPLSNEPTIPKT